MKRAWRVATFGTPNPWRRLGTLAVLGALSGLAETAVVVLTIALVSGGRLSSYPLASRLPHSSWAIAGLALGALAVLAAVHFLSARVAARAGAEVQQNLQTALVGAYLDAPWPAQAATRTGELQDLVTVRVSLLAYGAQEAAQALTALVNLTVVVAAAIAISPYAAAALLAAVAVVLLLARPFRGRRRRILRDSIAASTGLAVDVTETAGMARDLRVFGSSAAAKRGLEDQIATAAKRGEAARLATTLAAPLTRDAAVAFVVVGLAVIVTQTGLGFATLGATVLLMLRALAHAQSLASLHLRYHERSENLTRIEGRLAAWRTPPARGARRCPRVDTLVLREVRYTHPGRDRPALESVSLKLERGELVGIVGRTGAGKSTLAAVLLGLVAPDSGAVLANGVPVSELEAGSWHARTAWVGQEPRLLTATVAENVRFLREDIADTAVAAAAEAAGLARELEQWPDGLAHHVGPHGSSLSGGERQRVAIARAIAGRPDVLVLDEPTSALDAHAEAAVREALELVRQELIVVVIAHRLSTVRACDRIVVLDGGRIQAVAAPASLERESPYFREVLALSRS